MYDKKELILPFRSRIGQHGQESPWVGAGLCGDSIHKHELVAHAQHLGELAEGALGGVAAKGPAAGVPFSPGII